MDAPPPPQWTGPRLARRIAQLACIVCCASLQREPFVSVTAQCVGPPPDDPKQRCPNITRARKLLRWQPKVPLEEGLKRTIAYFESLLSRNTEQVHTFTRRSAR